MATISLLLHIFYFIWVFFHWFWLLLNYFFTALFEVSQSDVTPTSISTCTINLFAETVLDVDGVQHGPIWSSWGWGWGGDSGPLLDNTWKVHSTSHVMVIASWSWFPYGVYLGRPSWTAIIVTQNSSKPIWEAKFDGFFRSISKGKNAWSRKLLWILVQLLFLNCGKFLQLLWKWANKQLFGTWLNTLISSRIQQTQVEYLFIRKRKTKYCWTFLILICLKERKMIEVAILCYA